MDSIQCDLQSPASELCRKCSESMPFPEDRQAPFLNYRDVPSVKTGMIETGKMVTVMIPNPRDYIDTRVKILSQETMKSTTTC